MHINLKLFPLVKKENKRSLWAALFLTGWDQRHSSQAVAPCFGLTELVLQQDKPAGNDSYMQLKDLSFFVVVYLCLNLYVNSVPFYSMVQPQLS